MCARISTEMLTSCFYIGVKKQASTLQGSTGTIPIRMEFVRRVPAVVQSCFHGTAFGCEHVMIVNCKFVLKKKKDGTPTTHYVLHYAIMQLAPNLPDVFTTLSCLGNM